jgi:hypothetical protein
MVVAAKSIAQINQRYRPIPSEELLIIGVSTGVGVAFKTAMVTRTFQSKTGSKLKFKTTSEI